ncbi:unnamed protein product [Moneuplotes crassus]|uniref:F-box domain-containing protein n=2 Tax=Euplotes crassus TaxID=5936 RepID=A0AAD1UBV9_EUPCR|nr:unnamed protein product [Moneuplotes crassus]
MERFSLSYVPAELLNIILSYLSRKAKWKLRELSKEFRDIYVPSSMVSVKMSHFRYNEHPVGIRILEDLFCKCHYIQKLDLTLNSASANLSCSMTEEYSEYLEALFDEENSTVFKTCKTIILKGFSINNPERYFFAISQPLRNLDFSEIFCCNSGRCRSSCLKGCLWRRTSALSCILCGKKLSLKSLEELSINMCSSKDENIPDSWYEDLGAFLDSFPNLSSISLNGMRIGENYIFLHDSLKRVEKINLQQNGINAAIAMNLCNSLDLDKLEVFNLALNWLGPQGLVTTRERFLEMSCLKELHLNGNKMFKGHHDIEVMTSILQGLDNLEVLSLQENSMSPEDFKYCLRVLFKTKTLTHLNLSRNGLSEHSIRIFIKYMEKGHFKNLKFLDFSFNQINIEGFEALCKFYTQNYEFCPSELMLRGMNFDYDKAKFNLHQSENSEEHIWEFYPQLKVLQQMISQVARPGFKKLALKPNNLRRNVKTNFKNSIQELYPQIEAVSLLL